MTRSDSVMPSGVSGWYTQIALSQNIHSAHRETKPGAGSPTTTTCFSIAISLLLHDTYV
jgi:hypothetical protein